MEISALVRGRRFLTAVVVLTLSGVVLGSTSHADAHGVNPRAVKHARARERARVASSLTATVLRVDGLSNPIGLGDASPRLSWSFSSEGSRSTAARQTAYEIPRRVVAVSILTALTSGIPARFFRARRATSPTAAHRSAPEKTPYGRCACGMATAAQAHGAPPAGGRWDFLSQSDWSAR